MSSTTAGVDRLAGGVTEFCPLSVSIDSLAAMLNFELADHEVYDGGELQWFDDDVHGTGMLAFLSRREDRRVDYYAQVGVTLDQDGYQIGGGTRSWNEIDFDVARLEVFDDGVDAEVRFTDVDGRLVEVRIDDRDGRRRRRAALLAPVSAGIDDPTGLLLVWMPGFDLVRVTEKKPVIRIGGRDAATGRLPGAWLHRRHLIKYASPVVTAIVNRASDGPVAARHGSTASRGATGKRVVSAVRADHDVRLVLDPALPELRAGDGDVHNGRWHVAVDGSRLTGGSWTVVRTGSRAEIGLDIDEQWQPKNLPWLMRIVTTILPVFRRWPTTYRWRCTVQLTPTRTMTSRWERLASGSAERYRRATGS